MNFLLLLKIGSMDGYEKVAGEIGLNLLKTGEFLELNRKLYQNLSLNFIDQLNDKNLISGYSFTPRYNSSSKYKGNLIIGPDYKDIYPEEIVNLTKYVIKVNETTASNSGYWEINVNRILVGDKEISKKIYFNGELLFKKIRFDFSVDYIRATDEYTDYILMNFFNELIEQGKCIKHVFIDCYHNMGIKCKKDIDIKKFPNLIFEIPSAEPNQLILNYEDLFEEIGEYIYFKIILTNYEEDLQVSSREWDFGNEFFKNNIVTFNKKRKDIKIYTTKKEIKIKNYSNYPENKNKEIWIIIIILIIFAILGFLIYFLIKMINKKKKKRLNILEGNYDNID